MNPLKSAIALASLFFALVACNLMSSSPTSTFKAFWEAQKKKDVAGMKKTLSKSSVQMMETAAKAQGKSVDDALKEGLESPGGKSDKTPETRNEKIEGDSATLEVQDSDTKKWSKVYFVKEEKEWKIALDKTIEELFKNLGTP
jgi:flagellar hook-associated protein FlgK